MDVKERVERALSHMWLTPTEKEALLPFIRMEIKEAMQEAIREFVKRVEVRAESNMEKTGVVEGAHYAAMKAEFARFQ